MPISKTSPSQAMRGITAIMLLGGIVGWLGCRKAAPPSAPPQAAASAVTPATNSTGTPEAAAAADDSIVLKEDFETLDSGKWPKDWKGWESGKNRKMKIQQEGGQHFLEFTATNAGFRMRLSRTLPILQKYSAYDFSVLTRVQDMTPQRGQIQGATFGVDWLDANGKEIGESDLDYLTEPGGWRLLQGVYQAPPNATTMKIFPVLTRCGGTVDFKNITVKGVDLIPEKVIYQENFENAATPDQLKSWHWYADRPNESLVLKTESGTHFLEFQGLAATDLQRFGSVNIPLDPSWSRIRFSMEARGQNLTTDSTQGVAGLCVLGYWKDESNQNATPYRVQTDTVRTSGEWKRLDVMREIPPGAKSLELNLILLFATGGIDLRDIKVTVAQ